MLGILFLQSMDGLSQQGQDREFINSTEFRVLQDPDLRAAIGARDPALPGNELCGAVLNFLVRILALVGFTWCLCADIPKCVTVAAPG